MEDIAGRLNEVPEEPRARIVMTDKQRALYRQLAEVQDRH